MEVLSTFLSSSCPIFNKRSPRFCCSHAPTNQCCSPTTQTNLTCFGNANWFKSSNGVAGLHSTGHDFKWVAQNGMLSVFDQRLNKQLFLTRRAQGRKHVSRAVCNKVAQSESFASVFELGDNQIRSFHELPSGMRMEVIEQRGSRKGRRCPIVFVHGSFHAAWCWAVHWLPYFAAQGHDCFALSLLGQGESDVPPHPVAGTLQSHARDVSHFIRHKVQVPPLLLGHSFGGLIVQQYLSRVSNSDPRGSPASIWEGWNEPYSNLTAAILACSVPPSGNGGLVWRYIRTKPIASIKVTLSFAAKMFAYNLALCQETFFSPDMPHSLIERYQKLLKFSSHIPLFNLRELNSSLPVPLPLGHIPPVLVVGAENDFVVDNMGLQETASFYGTEAVVISGIAHDVMLDTTWEKAAEVLSSLLTNMEP